MIETRKMRSALFVFGCLLLFFCLLKFLGFSVLNAGEVLKWHRHASAVYGSLKMIDEVTVVRSVEGKSIVRGYTDRFKRATA